VPAAVRPNDDLFLGSLKIPMQRLLGNQRLTLGGATGSSVSMRSDRMEIGRDPQCDYPLDYPMISWRHAVLTREGNAYFVTDLNSRNGTYVNGLRVAPRVKTMLQPGSEIGLGSFRFRLLFSGQFERREYTGNVAIELVSLTVDIQQKGKPHRLLHPVSLTVFPSELISVMGPAGAGKTTLLKAMNGYTVPSNGRVLFNGADLYQFYDRFRLQMGYVPQDDIMHALLTVDEALFYTAKLRTDLRTHEIRQRTLQVLTDLGIDDIGDRQIGSPEMKVISGGQRKRVNIAMELLSDPNVLFLDEPTSGLSSYDALQVIRLLRRLATSGKTVILTIHQPSLDIYKEFDNLIMVSRDKGQGTSGALSYYGPAYPDSIQFFNPNRGGEELSPEMLLDGLAKQPTSLWVDTYDRSSYKKQFVIDRTGQMPQQSGSGNT
jgi:ABC-type multidrug transport system ATPase subunit